MNGAHPAAEAEKVLERARDDAESVGETYWLPETLRLLAEVRRSLGAPDAEVDGMIAAALELAETQGEPVLAERIRRSGRPRPTR